MRFFLNSRRRQISIFVVLSCLISLITSIPSSYSATPERIIDVTSVTWPNATPNSVTLAEIEESISTEVAPRWKRYTSFEGSPVDKSISFIHGLTLTNPIPLLRPMTCDGSAASEFMNAIRYETYQRLGIEDFSSRYLLILTPDNNCIWSGRALMGDINKGGGVVTLQDTASAYIIVHELGHSFGLGHSNLMRCDSGVNDGPWGNDCRAVEYGGAIDVMGNVDVDNPLSTYHQWKMGYLEPSQIRQSWLTEKIELVATDVAVGTRAIFLRDNQATYWLEYRRASFVSNYKAGLVIYRTDPPPISAIVSPNPEDALAAEFGDGVGSDYWMLNWDNFTYIRSRASGSMTLPQGSIATTFSRNISISATPTQSDRQVIVSITRMADTTPPPTPEMIDVTQWRYPNISIIKPGYDDGESAIAGFESDINGSITVVDSAALEDYVPTYLNPFFPPKTVFLKNLPEGEYTLAIRAIDVWGNKSPWSKSVKVFVDRAHPVITPDLRLSSITVKETQVTWSGLRDEGIGLCSTILSNPEGFVFARSTQKSSPVFTIPTGSTVNARAQVFDCLGNGMAGDLTLSSTLIQASRSKRTGKWSAAPAIYGAGALRCSGKCTASININGSVSALIGEGAADFLVAGKPATKIALSSAQTWRSSDAVPIGDRNKVIRISGSNFVFGGLTKFEAKISDFKPIVRGPDFPDITLEDPAQKTISRLGFNQLDFTDEWIVLPMARGTTLLDPTLDLCGSNYTSELLRTTRRQISVTKVESPYLFLSSESVRYASASAATNALAELKKNYQSCVTNKGGIEGGTFTPYTFQPLPDAINPLGTPSRVIVRATIGSGISARQLFAVYQYNGSLFTGMYIVKAGEKTIDDSEIQRWIGVADILAIRLDEAINTSSQ
jgi:hypothetical protein